MLFYICLGLGIVSLILFLAARKPDVTLKALFLKAITSVMFLLTGFSAFFENPYCPEKLALLFFAGGILGLLGDIWLDLKYVAKANEAAFLKAGFLFFLVCHVFYSCAMVITYGFASINVICGIAGLIIACTGCLLTEKLFKANYGEYKLIAIVYTVVLGFTTGLSGAAMLTNSFALPELIRFVGMVFFLLSDIVLSSIYFCTGGNTRRNIIVNHALYYAAQFLLMSSLFIS